MGAERPKKDQKGSAQVAYEAIAPVYDDFTAHNNYELWFENALPALESHGLHVGHLLDVACGTGKSFMPLLKRGWEVTGCDIAPAMFELARRKVGDSAALSVADMRALQVLGKFDLVMCLDDAINYLLSSEELEHALSGMRRNLAPDGLLIFDVNTLATYRTAFAEVMTVESKGRRLIWRGHGAADVEPGATSEATFEALPCEGRAPLVMPEVHRQRHFLEAEVREALARAGLECLDVFGHFQDAVFQRPMRDDAHTKAIYIARANPPDKMAHVGMAK